MFPENLNEIAIASALLADFSFINIAIGIFEFVKVSEAIYLCLAMLGPRDTRWDKSGPLGHDITIGVCKMPYL